MKILFFIHSLSAGGAERVLTRLANHWENSGHDVTIAIDTEKNFFYEVNDSITILNVGVQVSGALANLKRIQAYKQAILDVDPSIVISFMTSMNIKTTVAARLAKKPIIISERNTYSNVKSLFWRSLRRAVYPFSNLLLVQTAYEKDNYKFHQKVETIENPLVVKQIKNVTRENLIIAVGRLHPNKGFDLLIDAYSKLKNRSNWSLVIIGEGNERSALEQQISSLNLEENITLVGRTSNVEHYYKKASLFVLSSRMEGFPNVLCEAMAHGCPAIAFDCLTGPKELIEHNVNGLLVEPENTGQLRLAIDSLIHDKSKREFLAKEALTVTERLAIETISQKWLQLINNLLNKHP